MGAGKHASWHWGFTAAAAAKIAVMGSSSKGKGSCGSRPTCITPCTPGAQPSSRAMGSMATLRQQVCGMRGGHGRQRQLCALSRKAACQAVRQASIKQAAASWQDSPQADAIHVAEQQGKGCGQHHTGEAAAAASCCLRLLWHRAAIAACCCCPCCR